MTTRQDARRTTIVDVAKEAEVSFATVSRVVSGKGYVSRTTRERVQAAMERTGYSVNRPARALAGGQHQVIGLLVPELDTSYMGEILRGIEDELWRASYDLMLYTTHRHRTRESTFVRSITEGMVDGLLMVLPIDPSAYIDSIRKRGLPFVLIDHEGLDDTGPSVGSTNRLGASQAMDYLIALGHRRIGFVTGNIEMDCAHERLAGYREALDRHGVPCDPDLIRTGDFHRPLAYRGTRELLELQEPPTAIFASNDVSALGVMDAVRDLGKRIPDDISVIGFDDIPDAARANPPLTTVRQPMLEMGRLAASMLLDTIADPTNTVGRREMRTELVVRLSCRSLDDAI